MAELHWLCDKLNLFDLRDCDIGDDNINHNNQNCDSIVDKHYTHSCGAEVRAHLVLFTIISVIFICRYACEALFLAETLQLTSVFNLLAFFMALFVEDEVVVGESFKFIAVFIENLIALCCRWELWSYLQLPFGSIKDNQEWHEQAENQCKEHFPLLPTLTATVASFITVLPNDIWRFRCFQKGNFRLKIKDLHFLTIDSPHVALFGLKSNERRNGPVQLTPWAKFVLFDKDLAFFIIKSTVSLNEFVNFFLDFYKFFFFVLFLGWTTLFQQLNQVTVVKHKVDCCNANAVTFRMTLGFKALRLFSF